MPSLRSTRNAALVALLGATALPARAAEVDFAGFYRARARAFDTLSLDRSIANEEGLSAYTQHWLWLRPQFILSESVAVKADIRGLADASWGHDPTSYYDPFDQGPRPAVFTDHLAEPYLDTSSGRTDEAAYNLSLWRAWGEVHTDIGRFDFGRVPLHWGQGIWQNDGLTGLDADFLTDAVGDSGDRVQWEHLFDDLYVSAAVGVRSEGFVNLEDDIVDYEGSVAYRTERLVAGLRGQLRRVSAGEFNLVTLSGAADAELGRLSLRGEVVGQFGGGDLGDGLDDVRVFAGGAVVDALLETDAVDIGLVGGFASGDGDVNDDTLHRFAFDRNYSLGLILFEQTMPVLQSATPNDTNLGRDVGLALSGPAVTNAIFVKPRLARDLVEDTLTAELAAIGARAFVPPVEGARHTYGLEVDAGLRYTGIEHLELGATLAMFLPGDYFGDFDAGDADIEFSDPVFGGQLGARIEF